MSELDTLTAAPPPPDSATPPSGDERTWALMGHLSAFTAFVTGGLGSMLGPLVVWLIKRDTMPFVADQAKEALNFNITVFIIGCVLVLFSIVTFGIGLLLAWPLGIALFIGWVVLTILAAIKANEGVAYRYPWTLRLVK
ncbi:MAG: DUF4870 domain-containing protein [Rhodanobacteraceae bacterium]|nr:DUF4870 domain-containing protein [Rhodanobacteraceae bacterium]